MIKKGDIYRNKSTGRLVRVEMRSAKGEGRHLRIATAVPIKDAHSNRLHFRVLPKAKLYRIGIDRFMHRFERATDAKFALAT